MKTLLRAFTAAVVIALFHAATVGWSLGVALSSLLTGVTLTLACNGIAGTLRTETIAVVTWLYWGLSYVSNVIEALYFRVIPVLDAKRSVLGGLFMALLVACILAWMAPPKSREQRRRVRSAPHLWWRIPLLALLFFVIYLSAGIAIHPWIKSFYQNRPLPSLGQLAVLQFCRGLLDVACIFPLLRRLAYSRQGAVWLSACIFTVLCGWGPLLLPNPYLPAPIRLAHSFEMGASGLAFGIITAMLLLKPVSSTSATSAEMPLADPGRLAGPGKSLGF
jgi:hypothetical protein